ncbi:MAG: hypothetical protein H0T73_01310 [Ardenticatenales bacterium]|nr:hypothetical protein [Ardenticatenales bacterium]
MSGDDTTTPDLLTRGIAAARAGDNAQAVRLLRLVTERDPANVEAWLWRASTASNSADKKAFLEEALLLDPENAEAKLALERVIELEGPLTSPLEDEVLFCTTHPDRETRLRCNRCGRPMCTDCAVRHPVGLRCRECVKETRSTIYQADVKTLALAFLVTTAISTIVGLLVILFGGVIWLYFWFFIGGAIGRAIAAGLERVVPRKRGKDIQAVVGVSIFLGLLLAGAGLGYGTGIGIIPGAIALFMQFHTLLYLGTAITAAVATLR